MCVCEKCGANDVERVVVPCLGSVFVLGLFLCTDVFCERRRAKRRHCHGDIVPEAGGGRGAFVVKKGKLKKNKYVPMYGKHNLYDTMAGRMRTAVGVARAGSRHGGGGVLAAIPWCHSSSAKVTRHPLMHVLQCNAFRCVTYSAGVDRSKRWILPPQPLHLEKTSMCVREVGSHMCSFITVKI